MRFHRHDLIFPLSHTSFFLVFFGLGAGAGSWGLGAGVLRERCMDLAWTLRGPCVEVLREDLARTLRLIFRYILREVLRDLARSILRWFVFPESV